MITIAATTGKGGEGKTTSIVNIASGLAQEGKKVLVLDMDPQRNATQSLLGLGVHDTLDDDTVTMFDVLYAFVMRKKNHIKKAIQPTQISPNLFIAAASPEMEGFKDVVKSQSREPLKVLSKILEKVEKDYDYCLIDCQADFSVYTESAVKVSDHILCPISYTFYGFSGASLVIPTILDIKGKGFTDYHILFTMHDSRAKVIKKDMAKIENELRETGTVIKTKISVDQNIKNSQAEQLDFMTAKKYRNTQARFDYNNVVRMILKEWK